MRQIIFLSMMLASNISVCQWCNFDFESTGSPGCYLFKDSASIWEIGEPQKSEFLSGYLSNNAIVTDTSASYPVSNVSSFIIEKQAGAGMAIPYDVWIEGYYYVDSDSLNDYGIIEVSIDTGNTWHNVVSVADELSVLPTLTGRSKGWKDFFIVLQDFFFNNEVEINDLVQFRFSFISDSIFDGLDGLMFDNIGVEDIALGIQHGSMSSSILVYPNPANETIIIKQDQKHFKWTTIEIWDSNSRLRLSKYNIYSNTISLRLSDFEPGVYLVKVLNESTCNTSIFIKK